MKSLELLSGNRLVFEPDKGYFIIDLKGNSQKLTSVQETGPLKEVVEMLSHGSYHALSNLLDPTGDKIFDKGVRSIKYTQHGYYIVEDNNEDELLNKYGYLNNEYQQEQCIVLPNGKILSNQWYDKVFPLPNNYIKVEKGNKENLLNLNGDLYLEEYVDYVTYFNGDYIYYLHNGVLYRKHKDGKVDLIRELENIPDVGNFHISGRGVVNGSIIKSMHNPSVIFLSSNHVVRKITEDYNNKPCNLISKNAKIIFRKWYDDIEFSCIPGIYYVKHGNIWNIVDITEKKWSDIDFLQLLPFQSGFAVGKQLDGTYCIIDTFGQIIASSFNSVMRIPDFIWEVDYYSQSTKTFFNGQGGDFIFLIQGLLLQTQWTGLFEKNNIWYYLDNSLQMQPLLKYEFTC